MELDRVDAQETPTQVFVTVLMRSRAPAGGWFAFAREHEAVVPLARPLGERELVHAPCRRAERGGERAAALPLSLAHAPHRHDRLRLRPRAPARRAARVRRAADGRRQLDRPGASRAASSRSRTTPRCRCWTAVAARERSPTSAATATWSSTSSPRGASRAARRRRCSTASSADLPAAARSSAWRGTTRPTTRASFVREHGVSYPVAARRRRRRSPRRTA